MLNASWNQLLQTYVDHQGRVNYRDWQAHGREQLQDWLNDMAQVQVSSLDRNAQLALWLNLYNALTIAQILPRYPLPSIRPSWLGIPNWVAFLRFFTRPLYEIEHQRYSLNQIEHQVLRSQFQDARTHFALVCASIGCPLLRAEAYTPDRVQMQLEEDAHRFINNPDKVRYEPQANILYCSKIFQWYQRDFLAVAPTLVAYLNRYLQDGIPIPEPTAIAYLAYDWSINQQPQ